MIIQVLHCPYCQGIDIVKHGLSPEGKQRYRCRACLEGRGRTFLLEYSYAGQSPEGKQQIVEMAMNASGIRDTARVLHVSPTTVINELKKRTGPARGESPHVAAPPARTGRGGDMACGCAGGTSWPQRRARRDVELRAQQSQGTLGMARHGSPHGQGVSLCIRTTAGYRLRGAQSAVGAVWHHAVLHRRLGGLRAVCGG